MSVNESFSKRKKRKIDVKDETEVKQEPEDIAKSDLFDYESLAQQEISFHN